MLRLFSTLNRAIFLSQPSIPYKQGVHMTTGVTDRLYYTNTRLATADAQVMEDAQEGGDRYIVLDRTIFHPQGGGQPSDVGVIRTPEHTFEVVRLTETSRDGVIRHFITTQSPDATASLLGRAITMEINLEARLTFARLHTAGHLLANIVEEECPGLEGRRGHHFTGGQAFVLFDGALPAKESLPTLKATLEARLAALIAEDRPIATHADGARTVGIEGLKAYPCGGTHLEHTGEIGAVTVRSIKIEKGKELKIGYDVR